MIRVFNATYSTDNVYAEGYIIFNGICKEIDGVFALDYIYIYNFNNHTFLNIKSCDFDNGIKYSFYEYFSNLLNIQPNNIYYFSSISDKIVQLEIMDEVIDLSLVQQVLQTLSYIKN